VTDRTLYQQVADHVSQLIDDEILHPGQMFPNEGQLALKFGLALSTIRRAFHVLQ
jgi:DNA-binding GntR family transcriptional regulator